MKCLDCRADVVGPWRKRCLACVKLRKNAKDRKRYHRTKTVGPLDTRPLDHRDISAQAIEALAARAYRKKRRAA